MSDSSDFEQPIVVHYCRYWLPGPSSAEGCCDGRLDLGRVVEVVLEPQVLWFCLLRKVADFKFIMSPSVYEEFAGGPLPAAFVDDPACYKGEPLRQERLMQHMLVNLPCASESRKSLLKSDFVLYDAHPSSDCLDSGVVDAQSPKNNISILPVYVEKHLRYAVLYLLWMYPKISHTVTKSVVVNSMPWPHGYYVYHLKVREIGKFCEQCGYSNLDFTLKELSLMLKELQRILRSDVRPFNYRPGYWMEGSIFANLSVLFSIPCHGLEELLSLHREFYDLKAYCVMVNRTFSVVDLKPPFLCGNTFPLSYFVKRSCPVMKALCCAWDKLKDSQLGGLIYKRGNRYTY